MSKRDMEEAKRWSEHRRNVRALRETPRCEGREVDVALEFPGLMASYKELDAWLRDRDWVPDNETRTVWRLMKGRRVVIATMGEAIQTQLRKDRRAGKARP